ncbi:MAG: 50S ribosomal protein L3 [Calditrichaeota bacterium]|nr:50S ribosomal protein L3 [Calditrichota bacterium]MCB9368587.1 50S ribosomal protein L3 [Calditrichota bacterium]
MTGLIGKKVGMTRVFDEKGTMIPVTVIELGPNQITNVRTVEKNGYEAVCLGFGQKRDKLVRSPQKGHYKSLGITAPKIEREFRGMKIDGKKVGDSLSCDLFAVGEKVKVVGTSKGRGFAGVIKRHNFGRQTMTHGTHEFFRHGGSIGSNTFPGRTLPGLRMPGRMGADRVSVRNLKIVRVDADANLIMIGGAIPGPNHGIVIVEKQS